MIVNMELVDQDVNYYKFSSVQSMTDIIAAFKNCEEVIIHIPGPETSDDYVSWVCEEYLTVSTLWYDSDSFAHLYLYTSGLTNGQHNLAIGSDLVVDDETDKLICELSAVK